MAILHLPNPATRSELQADGTISYPTGRPVPVISYVDLEAPIGLPLATQRIQNAALFLR
jgi:hypothetical protein